MSDTESERFSSSESDIEDKEEFKKDVQYFFVPITNIGCQR